MRLALLALLVILALPVLAPGIAWSQTSTPTTEPVIAIDNRTPKGALYRSIVPGWGQIYNGHYGKLPFVYGGLLGFGYLAIEMNKNYQEYNDAYHYLVYEDMVDAGLIETNPNEDLKDAYDGVVGDIGNVSSSTLRSERDRYRRNRDLARLGVIAVYGLSILDAYVSAHLLDFDVDENLSIRMNPAPYGLTFRATYRLY